jgi:predicted RNA-binding protein associated with RNAse of E/G family
VSEVTVIKLDINGKETWRYPGKLLKKTDTCILLEALFNRDDGMFEGIYFKRGDRFIETFYSDRWYNIFEMHDRDDDSLKGYYCNIGCPAVIENGIVSYRDLALDLLVYPDGARRVLDEDEFEALEMDQTMREQALSALAELQERFANLGVKSFLA